MVTTESDNRFRVAVDIGGTFTDIALLTAAGLSPQSKISSTPADQRGCKGKPLCQPSQPPHEYGPGIRPKDATDKEARTPRSRGRSVVVLYNGRRPHQSLDDATPDQAYFTQPSF